MALPTAVDDGPTSTPEHWTPLALGIVALCFAINMADGVDVTILSYIAPRLQADWHIGADIMGRLFSAGLVGMAIGGMGIAPLADRLGRRRVILFALVLMSCGMLASGWVHGVVPFMALRVLVGAGIGTVLAAMAALAAEVAPMRHRNLAVGLVQAGYPFAAIFMGLGTAALLPSHGWRWLLTGAGMLTLVLLPAGYAMLPHDEPRAVKRGGGSVLALFAPKWRARTLALWTAVFCGLMVLYFIVSWIPKLAIEAGLSETNGIYAGALYNLGAFVGTVAMSTLALRIRLVRLVPAMLSAAAVAMLVFGAVAMPVGQTMAIAFAIGMLLQGGYNGIWPMAAAAYPHDIRATGIGWAIGIGRAGAVIGPLMGGYLMAAHLALGWLFAAYCVPLLACACGAALVERGKVASDT